MPGREADASAELDAKVWDVEHAVEGVLSRSRGNVMFPKADAATKGVPRRNGRDSPPPLLGCTTLEKVMNITNCAHVTYGHATAIAD